MKYAPDDELDLYRIGQNLEPTYLNALNRCKVFWQTMEVAILTHCCPTKTSENIQINLLVPRFGGKADNQTRKYL